MAKRLKGSETTGKRNVVPVALAPEVNRVVNAWCEKTGGSKATFVARLITFFASAPESMQKVMLQDVPSDLVAQYVERAGEWIKEQARVAGERDVLTGLPEDLASRIREYAAYEDKTVLGYIERVISFTAPQIPRGRLAQESAPGGKTPSRAAS